MAIEIERKFLVTGEGWRRSVLAESAVRQGYLSSNAKATVRVRIRNDSQALLTLKGAVQGMTRPEFEYEIPLSDGLSLLEMARPHVVEKRRYDVLHDGLTWEVDVFEGRHAGLILAEVELDSEDQALTLPDWVGREVTDDDRYYNASLSRSETVPGVDPDVA